MLSLGSTYLIVKDMPKSIQFYESLLDMKVTAQNFNRFAQFNFNGSCIALFNPKYDEEFIKHNHNLQSHYSEPYLAYIKNRRIQYGNNFVLNFYIENLNREYERIRKLDLGTMTEIMYVNITSPYHFFLLEDPDGNTIEITGNYTPQTS